MLNLLQQQYPSELMPLLAEHSQGALQEACDAFPRQPVVISSNLQLFVTAVEVTFYLLSHPGPFLQCLLKCLAVAPVLAAAAAAIRKCDLRMLL